MVDTLESPYIHAATAENFKSLVLENSRQGPVLVNFWSHKAGPCLRLYPVLDKLVHHYAGRLLLINIDTQTEVKVTKEYGIASVPTLKLFRNEEVVETIHGYQSEAELMKMLDGYVARDSDQSLSEAIELYTTGEAGKAYQKLADAILDDPVNPRLPLAMAKLLRYEKRYDEAVALLSSLPDAIRKNHQIVRLYNELYFYQDNDENEDVDSLNTRLDENPGDIPAMRQRVNHHVIQQEFEQALQQLVHIIELEPEYDHNYAQQAMLKLFIILGEGDPLITRFRPHLKRYSH